MKVGSNEKAAGCSHLSKTLLLLVVLGIIVGSGLAQVPPAASQEFQRAVTHFQEARYEAALEIMVSLEERFPENADIQHLLAILLDLNGQAQRGNQHFARAVELAPDRPLIRSNYATSLMQLGRTEAAVEQFEAVLERIPDHPTANFNLGTIFLQQRSPATARPYLERAFAAQPELYANGYQLAFCDFLLGDYEAAGNVIDKLGVVPPERVEFHLLKALNDQALGRENRVTELLEELRPTLQGQPALRRQVILLMLSRQLYEEALPLLEAVSVEHPGSDTAWLELARARLHLGQTERALEDANKALGVRESGPAHAILGDILEAQDQPVEAVHHYQRAVDLDPTEAHLFALGYEFLSHWNWDAAEQVFQRGLEGFPESWRLWLGLGASHLGQNENEKAARAFIKAIEISPQPLAYHLLSVSFEQAGEVRPEARAAFESYFAAQPDDPWANYYRMMAIFEDHLVEGTPADELDPPLQNLVRVAERHPGFFEAHFLLGEIYASRQEWPLAVAALERAVAVLPNHVQAHYKLGLALQRLGRTEEAQQQLARYQTLKEQEVQAIGERTASTKKFILEMKQP